MHLCILAELQSKNKKKKIKKKPSSFLFATIKKTKNQLFFYQCNCLATVLFARQVKNYKINKWKVKVQSLSSL